MNLRTRREYIYQAVIDYLEREGHRDSRGERVRGQRLFSSTVTTEPNL